MGIFIFLSCIDIIYFCTIIYNMKNTSNRLNISDARNHLAVGGYIISSDEHNKRALFQATAKIKRWANLLNAKYYAKPQHTVPREEIFAIQRIR